MIRSAVKTLARVRHPSLHALGVAELRRRRGFWPTKRKVFSPIDSDWDRDVPPYPINSGEVAPSHVRELRLPNASVS
jgi:hypothetical protein